MDLKEDNNIILVNINANKANLTIVKENDCNWFEEIKIKQWT